MQVPDGLMVSSTSAIASKPKPRFSPSRGLLFWQRNSLASRPWRVSAARLACPIFLRGFGASRTEKCVKGSGLGDTTAMLHDRRIINARGIQEWHGHNHQDRSHSTPLFGEATQSEYAACVSRSRRVRSFQLVCCSGATTSSDVQWYARLLIGLGLLGLGAMRRRRRRAHTNSTQAKLARLGGELRPRHSREDLAMLIL
jgi:MYXO-CTERM domain-containing protein